MVAAGDGAVVGVGEGETGDDGVAAGGEQPDRITRVSANKRANAGFIDNLQYTSVYNASIYEVYFNSPPAFVKGVERIGVLND